MAYSLRLPDTLDAAARAEADYLGISLNALVCVALGAYLRAPGEPAPARAKPRPQPSAEPTIAERIPTARKVREKAVDNVDLDPKLVLPAKFEKQGWRERQRERDTAFR